MSRIHDALKPKRQDIPDNRKPEGTASLEQSGSQLRGPSQNKRSNPSGTSPLFHADPEENIRLWMQKYFPGASISREQAIQQWLSKPPESRVYSFLEVQAKSETSTNSEPPAVAPQEPANVAYSRQAKSEDMHPGSARAPRFIGAGKESLRSERSRNLPKLIFRIAAYSVVAVLVIRLLWAAMPMIHVAPHADSSIAASPTQSAGSAAVPQVPASLVHDQVVTPSENSTLPSRIQSLSIGCKDTQPCIEINTLGKEVVPRLSTLNNPDRLVVDFQGASYSSDLHRMAVGRGVVKDVRIRGAASPEPPNTRMVVDLTAASDYDLRAMKNKFVLNIYPKITSRQRE